MRWSIAILLFIVLTRCDNPININLPPQSDQIVIEGTITDQPGPQQIRISQVTNFASKDLNPVIEDAQVIVWEFDIPRPFTYHENGIYLSDSNFMGTPNFSYTLQVILAEGDTIVSTNEQLAQRVAIDTLVYESFEANTLGNQQEIVYYPVLTVQDPIDVGNYYRLKVYQNGELFEDPEFIILENDRFFNGKLFRNDLINFEFDVGDTIRVELLSISENTYDFYTQFIRQATLLGTSSGTAPATLEGNLTDISNQDRRVLGFFSTTSQNASEIVISQ